MKYLLYFFIVIPAILSGQSPSTDNTTYTYNQLIDAYRELDNAHAEATLIEVGPTDSGRNLSVFIISRDTSINSRGLADITRGKTVLLINNGIHPGESCGIDASLKFAREVLQTKLPEKLLIAIIPSYNIGGMLNRGAFSRANQDGPEEHGFRGNARHLDLNRDFIKADALNTRSFYALFHTLQPHIFVDTHTSNGANYQYTMTLISTQKDKLNPILSKLLNQDLEPYLFKGMEQKGWPMTPYVNVFGYTPDKGFASFLETPRYASGYTALFNTIGFITETHMLKPYQDRVASTYSFLETLFDYTVKNGEALRDARNAAFKYDRQQHHFDLSWKLDSQIVKKRDFAGYEYSYEKSKVHNGTRLKYHTDKPRDFTVNYYDTYKATDSARVPRFYVLPGAWREVALLLQYNGVELTPISQDTSLEVTSYYLSDPEFVKSPYEGHFLMTDVKVSRRTQKRKFLKGDFLINTDQENVRFIMAVLEPSAVDSYLRWNFFDEIFQQKEYFSAYVFEDTAEQLLADNPDLQNEYEQWKKDFPMLAKNSYAALTFIYRHSPYYEKEHLRYPVARVE